MTFPEFFAGYWWLMFPVGGMLMGVIGMISHYNHRNETLKILKSYVDQGKEPPAALLDAMRSDEDHDYYYRRRRYRRYGRGYGWGGFRSFVPFAALAAGFGYFGYYGGGPSIFIALALAFGVAAAFMLLGGIVGLMMQPKFPPADKDDL